MNKNKTSVFGSTDASKADLRAALTEIYAHKTDMYNIRGAADYKKSALTSVAVAPAKPNRNLLFPTFSKWIVSAKKVVAPLKKFTSKLSFRKKTQPLPVNYAPRDPRSDIVRAHFASLESRGCTLMSSVSKVAAAQEKTLLKKFKARLHKVTGLNITPTASTYQVEDIRFVFEVDGRNQYLTAYIKTPYREFESHDIRTAYDLYRFVKEVRSYRCDQEPISEPLSLYESLQRRGHEYLSSSSLI